MTGGRNSWRSRLDDRIDRTIRGTKVSSFLLGTELTTFVLGFEISKFSLHELTVSLYIHHSKSYFQSPLLSNSSPMPTESLLSSSPSILLAEFLWLIGPRSIPSPSAAPLKNFWQLTKGVHNLRVHSDSILEVGGGTKVIPLHTTVISRHGGDAVPRRSMFHQDLWPRIVFWGHSI